MINLEKTYAKFGYPTNHTFNAKDSVVVECDYCQKELVRKFSSYQQSLIHSHYGDINCRECVNTNKELVEEQEVPTERVELFMKDIKKYILRGFGF